MVKKNIYRFGIPQGGKELINSLYVVSNKKHVSSFNNLFASSFGPEYSSFATNKGRTAIYLLLKSLNYSEGTEILVPSFICETVIKPILRAKLKPKLIDVDPNTYTIDVKKLDEAIGPRTKAMIVVHTFGYPCDMDPLLKIAKDRGITVIEDCAQALGAEYNGKKVGTLGDAAIFSFHIDKMMTTGYGGLILTKDPVLSNNIKNNPGLLESCNIIDNCKVTSRFLTGFRYCFPIINSCINKIDCSLGDAPYGPTLLNVEKFNKEMSPVSARIGLIQFMKLNNMLEKRRRNASILEEGIKGIDFLEAPQILKNTNPSFLCYTVSVKTENLKEDRIKIINELNKKNIEANNYIWPYAIHQIPDYQKVCELGVNDFSGTDKVIRSIINIPVHPLLEEKDMERIVRTISAIDL